MREIVPNIFTWPWHSEPHGYDFNGYLLRSPEGNICIDPVKPNGAVLAEIVREGVARILLSNRNHSRAANDVRQATGARTAIHAADAAHATGQGTQIDDDLKAGQKIGPLKVVAVPGKSPGEVAFHWPERRILLVGDAVVGDPPGKLKLLPEKVIDDLPGLRESIRKLIDLDFDTLLVGDGEPILERAKEALKKLAATFPG